jgi:signal transduction histidine kinase
MKRLIALFIFLFCKLSDLYSQSGSHSISFKDIPLDIHLQIGFLFVYIVLGLLFLMLFIFSPDQRLNLFFSLYNMALALMILNIQFLKNDTHLIAENIVSRLIGVNVLLFILYALDRIKPIYYWFVAFLLFVDLPLAIILRGKHAVLPEIFHILFTLICLWQMIAAFTSKKAGDWLIGMVALSVVVINASTILFFFAGIQLVPYAAMGIIPFIITVSVVIYLALRYGRTNSSLEQQLKRVQVLSEENLKSEKEKQQILAGQNEMLEKQVIERTTALRKSLTDLTATQAQLIQSEKMASLGELTAGIAHEIQNPLNFVNNFSDVNTELVEELEQEANKGNIDEVKLIANEIKQNEQKINHHGKRADSIVKGMLQHSRASSGKKEPVDINALADEYLRLSYHGLRAKDKSFNADFKIDFDESIGKINIVPQDIGRVLLNLYNNAFYAASQPSNGDINDSLIAHNPTVWVSTKKEDDKIVMRVKDNGPGISQKIVDKIFQPFFTTKASGQGTGLGLSLSYDIIKAHGGELKVETKEGEFAEFLIRLPIA